jgi:hypothetical protein
MMDLFDLYAKISLDDREFQKGIADAGSKFKSFAGGMGTVASKGLELGKQLTGAIDKIGQTAVSAFGKVTAGAGTVLAGIGALGKMAVDGFADYEQLTGERGRCYGLCAECIQDSWYVGQRVHGDRNQLFGFAAAKPGRRHG